MPKCGTTAVEAALITIGGTRDTSNHGGHARMWDLPSHRFPVWATVLPPLTWYRRVYLHAVDTRSESTLPGLLGYGCGYLDFRSWLRGVTHPSTVRLTQGTQEGLIFRAPTCAAVDLATGSRGLWSWAVAYYCGDLCPSPGVPTVLGVDALVDALQLQAGVDEIVGAHLELPRANVRGGEVKAWLQAQPLGDEERGWVREADGAMMREIGYAGVDEPRSTGAVWRR
jgi:hypothetical protein